MFGSLLKRPQSSFVRSLCARGVTEKVARALESAAYELYPEDPLSLLSSRWDFEKVAMQAVIGDAGNLELSYRLVDDLATTLESLGLARESDVPDPFRRVWIANKTGDRVPGVVLRCEKGEVAVFCAPDQALLEYMDEVLTFSYRGFDSSVAYDLVMNDRVRLPQALVIHLTRPHMTGSIGRDNRRYDVRLTATVRVLGDVGTLEYAEPRPCEVHDVSAGGMRIVSDLPFERNHAVELEVDLEDGQPGPCRMPAIICWNREDQGGGLTQGLEYSGLSPEVSRRYELYLGTLTPSNR